MESPDPDPDSNFSPRSDTALRAPSTPFRAAEPCPRETCHCGARSAVTTVALHKASTRNLANPSTTHNLISYEVRSPVTEIAISSAQDSAPDLAPSDETGRNGRLGL